MDERQLAYVQAMASGTIGILESMLARLQEFRVGEVPLAESRGPVFESLLHVEHLLKEARKGAELLEGRVLEDLHRLEGLD